MLVAFEDKTFFNRNEDSHTVLSPLIMAGAFKYINKNTLSRPFQVIRKIFSRGYGTIEMQLIRNIGVERGYDTCVLRRKAFEIIYSTIIFNSYRRQFSKDSDSVRNYKYWVLWCYMQKVPVKFSRRFFPLITITAPYFIKDKFAKTKCYSYFIIHNRNCARLFSKKMSRLAIIARSCYNKHYERTRNKGSCRKFRKQLAQKGLQASRQLYRA